MSKVRDVAHKKKSGRYLAKDIAVPDFQAKPKFNSNTNV